MLRERSAGPALMQALCLARSFSGVVSPAHTAQHTRPERRAGGCVGSVQVGQASTRLLHPFPTPPCLSLSFPAHAVQVHQEQSCVPLHAACQDISCKVPLFRSSSAMLDVFPMTVCKPFDAGVCPGVCGVSGSSGAGIRSTTEVLSVTQHQLDTFSSHACDVRLH